MRVRIPDRFETSRLFGMVLSDLLAGSPVQVVVEPELVQPQRSDVLLLRQGEGPLSAPLPDGVAPLARFNLLTFKSRWETLDAWALKELCCYQVLLRKRESRTTKELLPESDFRLYAACSRYPHNLAGAVALTAIQPGVYDCRWGTDTVRIIVAGELPEAEHNVPFLLFGANEVRSASAAERYKGRSELARSVVLQLARAFVGRGILMPYRVEDFKRDVARDILEELTPQERVATLTPQERLHGLSPEQILRTFSPEQLLTALTPEQRQRLAEQLSAQPPAPPRKRRGKK